MIASRKLLVIGHGTRGDVQPAIALGKALQARGHQVRVLASANFAGLVASHGLAVAPSRVDTQALMNSEGGQEWVERGSNPYQQMRIMRRLLQQYGPAMIEDTWAACQEADAVISAFISSAYTISLAQALHIPHVIALLQPSLLATRDGRVLMNAPLPGRISRLNHWFAKLFVEPMGFRLFGEITNQFRQEVLGLPPQQARDFVQDFVRTPVLLGYSRHVVPFPAEWPDTFHQTGYWFLNEGKNWQPPAELAAFLAEGDPPIYIGFGSMTGRRARRTSQIILEAIAASGCRALLHGGWARLGYESLPPTVFPLDGAPHDWLFPRMAAVVHHGGAGTTAAGLAAGVPTVIVPHMADQPFWGRRVADLGVGPEPIPRPRLTADRLAVAIEQATNDAAMRARSADLAARIGDEDGIAAAVAIIEREIDVGREASSHV